MSNTSNFQVTSQETLDQTSIVIVGQFRPSQFNPRALSDIDEELKRDFSEYNVKLLIPEEAIQFDTQFASISVEREKIEIGSQIESPVPEKVRDLILRLIETEPPALVKAFGINRNIHFSVPNEKTFREFGERIYKKDFWNTLVNDCRLSGISIVRINDDELKSTTNIRVETSVRIRPFGIFIGINDHFPFRSDNPIAELSDHLVRAWARCAAEHENLISHFQSMSVSRS